jgi:hypothetical protein
VRTSNFADFVLCILLVVIKQLSFFINVSGNADEIDLPDRMNTLSRAISFQCPNAAG